ncbi:MAG: hypothetical protein HYX93_03795 [Chloroflexi bacterium]|nr:hypothetical protein [Chloroflexota bacterium]
MSTTSQENESAAAEKTPWRQIGIALGLSLVGTALLGGVLLLVLDDIWWVAAGGILSLFSAGVYVGRGVGEPEPLYGTLLAAAYVAIAVVVIFVGTFLATLPDPLPGLAIGDSTFFFVSPLLMLASGVAGTIVGGVIGRGQSQVE